MTNISKSIIDKIKKEKIKPIPRWQFVLCHVLLGVSYLVAIFIGAISFSIILRLITGVEWNIVREAGKGPISCFFLIIPYIWFVVLGIVAYLASKLLEKTKKGYKYKHVAVVLSSVFISVIIGSIFYSVGVGHFVEKGLNQHVKPYADWSERRDRFLVAPDKGVLVGKIMEIKSDENIIVVDFLRTKWEVDISDAKFKDGFELHIYKPVGILGEKVSDNSFKAKELMYWRPADNTRPKRMMPPIIPAG